jgi:redox-sensitive bicupin YhaK (pirin superfamily)
MGEQEDAIELVVAAQKQSIGAGSVLRVLPTRMRRTVGPFVFFDHMSDAPGGAPQALDVDPHPHIGIATVTYLFEGALLHRDSIGSSQVIEPGGVNWMSAGRGIVHSERTPIEMRARPPRSFGVQCWVALPESSEMGEPSFQHFPRAALPSLRSDGAEVLLIAGALFKLESPVRTDSPLLCAALSMSQGARLTIPSDHQERALVLLDGDGELGGVPIARHHMVVLREGSAPSLRAHAEIRAVLIGGPPLKQRRYMDWNFVSTRREQIDTSKEFYRKGLLGQIPGEAPNLPLPEDVA